MVSAIVMAGYNNKRAVKRYSRIVAENYGETFIETGYKPLREFKTVKDGIEESKPLIQYILEVLFENDLIDEIIIVGHKMLLSQRLWSVIERYEKPCSIINQNAKISNRTTKLFNIIKRKVKHNTIAGNLIKAYAASAACQEKKHALFVASDSPLTTGEFIESFLKVAKDCRDQPAVIFPIIPIEDNKDKLNRKPVKLINDTAYQVPSQSDNSGRQGFRLSSLMYANPYQFDINTVNIAYNLRKCLSPNVQLRLFRITRSLGYPNVYSKYFIRKDLSIKEVENITSKFFRGRIKLIPMSGEETTYDYDGTELEYRTITELLSSMRQKP